HSRDLVGGYEETTVIDDVAAREAFVEVARAVGAEVGLVMEAVGLGDGVGCRRVLGRRTIRAAGLHGLPVALSGGLARAKQRTLGVAFARHRGGGLDAAGGRSVFVNE